jgi:RNA polymerase sigma factor (TIGR02999 family)
VSSDPSSQPTRLLQQINAGDRSAVERLLPIIYDELHAQARRIMGGERREHTLQPTALINEAFLRLVDQDSPGYEDRMHFLRVASRAMRNVLVDHARARAAQKRGGDHLKVTLDAGLVVDASAPEQLLVVHETLERLGEVDPQLAQIVELRYFGGLIDKEIGAAIGVSERTVQRSWRMARAWMTREMAKETDTRPDVG